MEELIETFHINWKLMLAQIVNFGLVFFVLYILAAKPLKKLITERTEEITKGLNDAKKNAETLKFTIAEYEATMVKARKEANDFFEKGKKETEAKKVEILAQAQKEMAATIEHGKKIIETERIKMVNEAKNEVAELILQATEKILASSVGEQPREEKNA